MPAGADVAHGLPVFSKTGPDTAVHVLLERHRGPGRKMPAILLAQMRRFLVETGNAYLLDDQHAAARAPRQVRPRGRERHRHQRPDTGGSPTLKILAPTASSTRALRTRNMLTPYAWSVCRPASNTPRTR